MLNDSAITWICTDCAKAKGWTWPKGHSATFHNGKCDACQQEKGVCPSSDWNNSGEEQGREL